MRINQSDLNEEFKAMGYKLMDYWRRDFGSEDLFFSVICNGTETPFCYDEGTGKLYGDDEYLYIDTVSFPKEIADAVKWYLEEGGYEYLTSSRQIKSSSPFEWSNSKWIKYVDDGQLFVKECEKRGITDIKNLDEFCNLINEFGFVCGDSEGHWFISPNHIDSSEGYEFTTGEKIQPTGEDYANWVDFANEHGVADLDYFGNLVFGEYNYKNPKSNIPLDTLNWCLKKYERVKRYNNEEPFTINSSRTISSSQKGMENVAEGTKYDDYHIEFDETYYDLARLLLRPLKKGKNTDEQNAILSNFSNIMNGIVIQRNNRFFLNVKGAGEFEMGLVSEGFRKLSTLTYLILSGSLNKKSILFWDEPETNMNPKMIYHVANSLAELSRMGVQVFITTHSYFIQQAFNLMSCYPSKEKEPVKINFISLYRDEKDKVTYESADCLADIQHNAIMEEFDSLYDREQDLMT